MELIGPSLWSLLFFLFCLSHPVSTNGEDIKLPSSPANLKELRFLKGFLEHKAERFRHGGLQKEPNHMKRTFVGRILKVGAGDGKGAVHGRGYRRPPSKGTNSATSLRLSGTFPLSLNYLFTLYLVVFLLPA